MNKRMSDLIDTYRDAVSQRVAFNSPEHRAAETAVREALLCQSQAVSVAELARKAALFREGTRRLYEGHGPNSGDMWFFELWHFLGDVETALSPQENVDG